MTGWPWSWGILHMAGLILVESGGTILTFLRVDPGGATAYHKEQYFYPT